VRIERAAREIFAALPPDVRKASGLPAVLYPDGASPQIQGRAREIKGYLRKGIAFPYIRRQSRKRMSGFEIDAS
jgi:hypothetical protein